MKCCQFKQLHPIWDGRLVSLNMGEKVENKERDKMNTVIWKTMTAERRSMIYSGLRPTNLTNGDNRGTLIHGRLKRETTPQLIL